MNREEIAVELTKALIIAKPALIDNQSPELSALKLLARVYVLTPHDSIADLVADPASTDKELGKALAARRAKNR